MASRKSTTTAVQSIDTSALGDYNTSDYCEKQYATVYYALRELQGLSVKRSLGDSFSWETLKERFTEVFGAIEERRYSLEQLLEYAERKFGKSLQDLQEINDRSWARRKARQEQQNNVLELPKTAEF